LLFILFLKHHGEQLIMSQGHLDRFSSAPEGKRIRTNSLSGSAFPRKVNQSKNTSYEKYKASLHAFFDGKAPLPGHIRSLATDAVSESATTKTALVSISKSEAKKTEKEPAERSLRRLSTPRAPSYDVFIEAIKRSTTPDEITRTINALFEADHQLPADEDILSKGLSHRDEEVVLHILQELKQLLTSQPAKSPRLLKTRLENAALLTSSTQIKALCKSLRELVIN
jgi:hypothetical protein